jgi:hypothetical protein
MPTACEHQSPPLGLLVEAGVGEEVIRESA